MRYDGQSTTALLFKVFYNVLDDQEAPAESPDTGLDDDRVPGEVPSPMLPHGCGHNLNPEKSIPSTQGDKYRCNWFKVKSTDYFCFVRLDTS